MVFLIFSFVIVAISAAAVAALELVDYLWKKITNKALKVPVGFLIGLFASLFGALVGALGGWLMMLLEVAEFPVFYLDEEPPWGYIHDGASLGAISIVLSIVLVAAKNWSASAVEDQPQAEPDLLTEFEVGEFVLIEALHNQYEGTVIHQGDDYVRLDDGQKMVNISLDAIEAVKRELPRTEAG